MYIDLAIVESDGNGGDLQMVGNDLAVVYGIENMPYLGMFGGNVEQVTKNKPTEIESLDWWGNNLLFPNDQAVQMNSITEKALNTIPLTSAGRVLIENAIKKDLEFLSPVAIVEVSVTITATDRINIKIRIKQNVGSEKIIIVNYKKATDGDFYFLDFNNDFNV